MGTLLEMQGENTEALAAIKQWASVRGILATSIDSTGWTQHWVPGEAQILVRLNYVLLAIGKEDNCAACHILDPYSTLVWALAFEGQHTIDVGVCPSCRGNPDWREWKYAHDSSELSLAMDLGWNASYTWPVLIEFGYPMIKKCSRCCRPARWRIPMEPRFAAPGRDTRKVSDLVLNLRCSTCRETGIQEQEVYLEPAMPQLLHLLQKEGWVQTGGTFSVDDSIPTAIFQRPCPCDQNLSRTNLVVVSDRLQVEGDPLGDILSLWLRNLPEGLTIGIEQLNRCP